MAGIRLFAAGLALLVSCFSLAHAQSKVRVFGDRWYHPNDPPPAVQVPSEWMRTYVDMPKDHDGDTLPLAVGIQITPGFLRSADQLPVVLNYTITAKGTVPDPNLDPNFDDFLFTTYESYYETIRFPQVGRNPFKFVSFTYNFYGHIPIGVYDFQHFDMRFFYETADWWWKEQYPPSSFVAEPVGYCGGSGPDGMYRSELPIPQECWPGSPATVVNLGHHVWGQGTHVYNIMEPGWQAFIQGSGTDHADSLTYGMQQGRLAYIEAMFSRDLALKPDLDECIDISDNVPKRFDTAHATPTTKCLLSGSSAFKLEYRNFIELPGGCLDMRNGTLEGYAPADLVDAIYGPNCKVPIAGEPVDWDVPLAVYTPEEP